MAENETSISRNGSDNDPLSPDDADRLLCPLTAYAHVTLAVSGGPDSLAMMALAAPWQRRTDGAPTLDVVTFDHRLRVASATEAAYVGDKARELGLSHRIISWDAAKPASGLASAGRDARYAALGAHVATIMRARQSDLPAAVVTAHHRDDQAETLLMRLARGTGVAGLAGMSPARLLDRGSANPIWLVRPFLEVAKGRLEATVMAAGWQAIDDPSNCDDRHERARWRRRMADIAQQLGLSSTALARTARRASEATDAIEYAARVAARDAVTTFRPGICATVRRDVLAQLPVLIRNHVVERLVSAYSGATAPPALSEIERLGAALASARFTGATLGGAVFAPAAGDTVRVFREWRRIVHPVPIRPGETALWDARLQIGLSTESAPAAIRPAGDLSNAERARLVPAGVDGLPYAVWQSLPVLTCPDRGIIALTPGAGRGYCSSVASAESIALGGAGAAWVTAPAHTWLEQAVLPS